MARTPDVVVELQRMLDTLEDCCYLARMGDLHQAALRFAEFRRNLDAHLTAEGIPEAVPSELAARAQPRIGFAMQVRSLAEEAWNRLVWSDVERLTAACGALSGAVEEHFRSEGERAGIAREAPGPHL